jgi:2-isopropylmalate synthase
MRFKELADRKADIIDEDIMALVSDEQHAPEQEYYQFISLPQQSSSTAKPKAEVVLSAGGVSAKAYIAASDRLQSKTEN